MTARVVLGALVVTTAIAASCGGDNKGGDTTYTQSGQSISVARGTQFAIELRGNPTTGYTWSLSAPPGDPVSLVDSDFTPAGSDKVGGGGVQRFTFDAKATGSTTLTFDYRRPWEKDVAPAQTATFPVTVT